MFKVPDLTPQTEPKKLWFGMLVVCFLGALVWKFNASLSMGVTICAIVSIVLLAMLIMYPPAALDFLKAVGLMMGTGMKKASVVTRIFGGTKEK